MNNTTIAQVPSNFQFLSVCHYINTLGIIFYNEKLITLEKQNHSVSVLNTLFEYFHNSKNESETKLQLLQKLLKENNFHGDGDNETHDLKYANETYRHIISNALFSHYGNIDGYLAGLINGASNVNYSTLKEKVFQDLSENYTIKHFCSSGEVKPKQFETSENLTFLAIGKIFEDHISPMLSKVKQNWKTGLIDIKLEMGEGHFLKRIRYYDAATEREDRNHHNFRKISKRSPHESSIYVAMCGKSYSRYVNALEQFISEGMSIIKDDTETLETVRESIEVISQLQIDKEVQDGSLTLWHSQTLTRPFIINYLKSLEGKEFYFNDITLLTANSPDEPVFDESSQISFKTKVYYRLKFFSHHGLVDLTSFHDSFTNQYIVFPEVVFQVENAKFHHGKSILILELEEKPKTKEEWTKIRQEEKKLIETRETIKSTRARKIENAAFYISLNIPLHRFTEMEKLLKQYILRIDKNTTPVPTYDMLATFISTSNKNPTAYVKWEIQNDKYIDDVLFQNQLYMIDNLENAKKRISLMFDDNYGSERRVKPLFEEYWKFPDIRFNVRFEDYYVLYLFAGGRFGENKRALDRATISIYRLALRQCEENSKMDSITLYQAKKVSNDEFKKIKNMDILDNKVLSAFYSNPEYALNKIASTSSSGKLVLFVLKIQNRAGLADIDRLAENPNFKFFVLPEIEFKKVETSEVIISGNEIFILKFVDEKMAKETRMVKIINNLYTLLQEYTTI